LEIHLSAVLPAASDDNNNETVSSLADAESLFQDPHTVAGIFQAKSQLVEFNVASAIAMPHEGASRFDPTPEGIRVMVVRPMRAELTAVLTRWMVHNDGAGMKSMVLEVNAGDGRFFRVGKLSICIKYIQSAKLSICIKYF
jgi:hypothetical protein